VIGDEYRAILWKNNTAELLYDKSSFATALYMAGSDLWVTGYYYYLNGLTDALVWKNGVLQSEITGNRFIPVAVYVNEDDVFVAGNSEDGALLFVNGISQGLNTAPYPYDTIYMIKSICVIPR